MMVRDASGSAAAPPVLHGTHAVATTFDERTATATLAVTGDIAGAARQLERELARATRTAAHVVVDLRRCTSCDSAALGAIVNGQRRLAERFTIVLADAGTVRRIFEITGLTRRLTVARPA